MNNKEFHKEFLIAYEDYKDNEEIMNDDCFRYCYKNHNSLSKIYIKDNISEYIDNCDDIKEMQTLYNNIKMQKEKKKIDKWIESVRTIESGNDVTNAFDFLWNIDDDEIWYKISETLADILEYAMYSSEYKNDYKKALIEENFFKKYNKRRQYNDSN